MEQTIETFDPETETWHELLKMDFEDRFNFIAFTDDKDMIWALSNRNRDKVSLVKFSLKTGDEIVIHEDPRVDITYYEICAKTQQPFMVYLDPDYQEIHFLDPELEKAFEPLMARIQSDNLKGLHVTSLDNDAQIFTVYGFSDKNWRYYLFDRMTGSVELLSSSPLEQTAQALCDIQPISFTSRDGLDINGYLGFPQSVGQHNLPMVLLVHGGPFLRDYWGYDRQVQFLANRGYLVMQINYRGSKGYGRKFMEAAIGEFAGKMQTDLIDGVEWAIAKGFADPDKIAIVGASYGGYAALVGLTFTPDRFACGIDVFGPSELESLLDLAPVWWDLGMPKFYKYVGNPEVEADRIRMKNKSPLYRLDAISKPILVIYGAEDVRVKRKQSRNVIEKLSSLGKDIEYYSFPDAGHGLYGKNRITYQNLMQEFLAKHLGGRASAE